MDLVLVDLRSRPIPMAYQEQILTWALVEAVRCLEHHLNETVYHVHVNRNETKHRTLFFLEPLFPSVSLMEPMKKNSVMVRQDIVGVLIRHLA